MKNWAIERLSLLSVLTRKLYKSTASIVHASSFTMKHKSVLCVHNSTALLTVIINTLTDESIQCE